MSIASKLASSVRQTKEQQETKTDSDTTSAPKQAASPKAENKTVEKPVVNNNRRFVSRRCWPD